jgi:hypothetical protein
VSGARGHVGVGPRAQHVRVERAMRPWVVLALAAVLAGGVPAASHAGSDETSPWQLEFMPYAWLPGAFGTIDVGPDTAVLDVSVLDVLKLATSGNAFTAGGYLGLRYERFGAFVDAYGGYVDSDADATVPTLLCTATIDARLKQKPVFVDAAVAYELGRWALPERERPITLGVYAGMRYVHIGAKLRAQASVVGTASGEVVRNADVSETFNWADPMLGVRWEVPVLPRFSLHFRGDIGGFGASSQLVWGIVTDVRWWVPRTPLSIQPWLSVGYRVVDFDHDFGRATAELQFRGPMSGLGLLF